MKALIIVAAILAGLLLLLFLPLRIRIVFPRKPRKKARSPSVAKDRPPSRKRKPAKKKDPSKLLIFLPSVLEQLGTLQRRFLRYLRIHIRSFEIVAAGEDAAKAAVLYGHAQTLCCLLSEFLYQLSISSLRDCRRIHARCNFLAPHPSFSCDLSVSLRIYQLLVLAMTVLVAFLRRKDYRMLSADGDGDDTPPDPETEKKRAAAREALAHELVNSGF